MPNPSFEEYSQCPDDWNQFNQLTSWASFKETPDYFNNCENSNTFGVPLNLMGYQEAYSGNAYAGLIFYEKGGDIYNEMIGVQLSEPLVIGTKYFVSMRVVLKYNNDFGICCAQDKIGVKFTNQPFSVGSPPITDNTAHIFTSSIISDTSNWTQIFGEFVADSAYNYLTVGNFFNNSNVSIIDIIPSNFSSYYFVDDICVSVDSSYAANYMYSETVPPTNNEIFIEYSDPAAGSIKVFKSYGSKPIKIILYNAIGQQILSLNDVSDAITEIDISALSAGAFFVVVESVHITLNQKLLKL